MKRLVAWTALLAFVPAAVRAAEDQVPPAILAQPAEPPAAGQPVLVECVILDESPIVEPTVYWRVPGERSFHALRLLGEGETYRAQLTPPPGARAVEYYLEAFDSEGNGPARYGTPEQPLRVEIPPAPVVAPSEQPGSWRSPLPWIVAAVGLAIVAVGVGLAVTSQPRSQPSTP